MMVYNCTQALLLKNTHIYTQCRELYLDDSSIPCNDLASVPGFPHYAIVGQALIVGLSGGIKRGKAWDDTSSGDRQNVEERLCTTM